MYAVNSSVKHLVIGFLGVSGICGIFYAIPAMEERNARKRLLLIQSRQPKIGKIRYLSFRKWLFRIGYPAEGEQFELKLYSQMPLRDSNPNLNRLENRLEWLRKLEVGGTNSSSVTYRVDKKGKTFFGQLYIGYGVRVIEVDGEARAPKYYALTVDSEVIPVITSDRGDRDRVPTRTGPDVRRQDFANPQDIDWMLGVKNFTSPDER